MYQTYRGRMIAYNLLIFLFIFFFILFCLVQGTLFTFLQQAKSQLNQINNDSQLYISEQLKSTTTKENYKKIFYNNSSDYCSTLTSTENCQIFLYDVDQNLLADSNYNTQKQYPFLNSLSLLSEDTGSYLQYSEINHMPYLYLSSHLTIDGVQLGYIIYQYPLKSVTDLMSTTMIYYLLALAGGFLVLIVITLSYSGHFIKPIRDLTMIADEINNGNYDVHIHYRRRDEIGDLTNSFNQMTNNINNIILQLNLERNRLASVLASLDDGVLAIDQNGQIITSNSYIKTYFNVSNPQTIYDFQYQSFLRDIFDNLKNGKNHISEEIECNDRNLLIIGSPIRQTGFEENYLIIIRNITASKHLQNEQKKFISSVSHELRTPLTTIIGYTDMLTRRQVTDEQILNRSLTTINHEGHRLLRLVDDLLNANRLDKAEFEVRKTNLDLHDLLINVIEQMQIKASTKEIEITYKSDPELPEILGDYDRLQQSFINILHNAIKYSDIGDVIDVISTVENNYIVTSIRDYGIGISKEEQQNIFNAFYRVDEDRARNNGEGGAGLGLYLVKQIIEKHEGKISINSIVGEGTNVTISLPIIEKH